MLSGRLQQVLEEAAWLVQQMQNYSEEGKSHSARASGP